MKFGASLAGLVLSSAIVAGCHGLMTPTQSVVAAKVPATTCATWDEWSCDVNPSSPYQCFATCSPPGANLKIACNGEMCAKSGSAFGASSCPNAHPTKQLSCGDCRAAVEGGCH